MTMKYKWRKRETPKDKHGMKHPTFVWGRREKEKDTHGDLNPTTSGVWSGWVKFTRSELKKENVSHDTKKTKYAPKKSTIFVLVEHEPWMFPLGQVFPATYIFIWMNCLRIAEKKIKENKRRKKKTETKSDGKSD